MLATTSTLATAATFACGRRALATTVSVTPTIAPVLSAPLPKTFAPKTIVAASKLKLADHLFTIGKSGSSTPPPSSDATGRPIVATLGTAETQAQHHLTPAERHFIATMVPRAAVNPGWQAHVARASEVRPASDVAVRAGSGSALVNALAGASKLSETESKADRLVASLGAALPLSPEDDVAARSAMLARILGLGSASAAMRNRWNTQRALEMTRRSPSDTGSPEAQAAVLTARINNLKQHLATNKKDKHNERGLTLLMSKRDKLLKYLKRQDLQTYYVTLHQLGL